MTVEKLLSAPDLSKATITVYSKGPGRPDSHSFCIERLPEFLEWFEYRFPNGVIKWDSKYEDGRSQTRGVALSVTFSLLEDDQGAHMMAKPSEWDEESYHQKVEEFSYAKQDAVAVRTLLKGE